ncbi:MAG: PKD domain-containing protein, partial [Bacteroidota bacterium]|nr:PKD domain-containing protein [Bacteroidota bacterium]
SAHEFGEHFDPVTSLISVDNGGVFTGIPMTMHIPLSDLQGRFPMAFYYDRAAGTLEAITPVGRGEDYLDVAVRHFSEIVVSATQIELLREGGGFHTLFDPAANGWSFVNDGTFPEHDGICAGMSIGAARFYRNFKSSPAIRGHYDNDSYWFRTPKIWQDDATGLRYCTELQKRFITDSDIWTLDGRSPLDPIWQRSEEDHFWSLCYALLVINQPQFLFLGVRNDPAAPMHAIVAYAYEINGNSARLLVYDPNYPAREGAITFDFNTGKFLPYTSASNATALSRGHTFAFDEIIFIPLSTICDTEALDGIWQKVQNGTIGKDVFPAYELYAVPIDDESLPRVKLLDGATGKTTFLPYRNFRVEIEPVNKTLEYSMVAWVDLPDIGEVEKRDPPGELAIEKTDRENLVGIQVNVAPGSGADPAWAGFQWFKLRLQSLWIEPADTAIARGQELDLVARSNGAAPAQARFEWDFGDGNTETVNGDSTVAHVFEESGSFEVRVRLLDEGTGREIGSATANVQVTEFRSVAIFLQGMDTQPPSTIKANNGDDIPAIVVSSKIGNAPALRWNDRSFEVDYRYTQVGIEYHTRISGTVSAEGGKIEQITGLTVGSGYDGAWTYNAALTITDFPITDAGPYAAVYGELRATAAQAKLQNVAFRQTSTDSEGNTTVFELSSIDWSSQQTTLSVYFYR